MSHLNPDDWFREPNDDAYVKTEQRTGPPLEYVAENLRRCLEACHILVKSLDKSELGSQVQVDGFNLGSHATVAFRSQLVGYFDSLWLHRRDSTALLT